MIDTLALLTHTGEVLISRSYRGAVTRVDGVIFARHVVLTKELSECPVRTIGSVHFAHIRSGNIILMASTRDNTNLTHIFKLLYQFEFILSSYFSHNFNESNVKKQYALVYELLDEIIDAGYPQILEFDVLKNYISQGSGKKRMNLNDGEQLEKITVQATGSCSWRAEGIYYAKNEVYIDVVESVNTLISKSGQILRSDVIGQIIVKAKLSGMPECKFGMNDKLMMGKSSYGGGGGHSGGSGGHGSNSHPGALVANSAGGIVLDDCKFHQCVRLSSFNLDRTITFIPPDNTFELMTYRISENVSLPIKVFPVVEMRGRTFLDISILLKSTFGTSVFASPVVASMALPPNTAKVTVTKCTAGSARFDAHKVGGFVWRIKKLAGATECTVQATAELVSALDDKPWVRKPICLDFQVPMYTASGVTVRFLRVEEKTGYKPIRWVRYICKAGNYQHRV